MRKTQANAPASLLGPGREANYRVREDVDEALAQELAGMSGRTVEEVREMYHRVLQRRVLEDGHKQWVDAYRPRQGREVCGNQPEVDRLRRWLLECLPDASQKRRKGSSRTFRDDSDEDVDDDWENPQAILVVGPPGTGKSAAVYAIAEELHLQVFQALRIFR